MKPTETEAERAKRIEAEVRRMYAAVDRLNATATEPTDDEVLRGLFAMQDEERAKRGAR